nr:MAG TPA: hypothetical protein [Herelleviridae sp.]
MSILFYYFIYIFIQNPLISRVSRVFLPIWKISKCLYIIIYILLLIIIYNK